jgi:hypothetical protein
MKPAWAMDKGKIGHQLPMYWNIPICAVFTSDSRLGERKGFWSTVKLSQRNLNSSRVLYFRTIVAGGYDMLLLGVVTAGGLVFQRRVVVGIFVRTNPSWSRTD